MKINFKQFIKSIFALVVLIALYAAYIPFGLIRSTVNKDWITDFVDGFGDAIIKLRKAMFGKIRQ